MIGILSALDFESELLKEKLEQVERIDISGVSFFKGRLLKKDAVLASMGIGKVNAGIITEAMQLIFKPSAVLHIGVAGALSDSLSVLEPVLAKKVSYHDFDEDILKQCSPFVREFTPSEELNRLALSYFENNEGRKLKTGRIVSGDSFIDSEQKKNDILKKYPDALCVDMESAALAHACTANNCPFLILRSISDFSNEGFDGESTYEKNKLEAAGANIKLIESIVSNYIC